MNGLFGLSVLSQAAPWWPGDARKAVEEYDRLLSRAALVSDADARGEILKWTGRADVPGSPAERYKVVTDALKSGAPADAALRERVTQLSDQVDEFRAMVANAEESYGTLPAPGGAGSAPARGTTAAGLALGGIALLFLVVFPLALD